MKLKVSLLALALLAATAVQVPASPIPTQPALWVMNADGSNETEVAAETNDVAWSDPPFSFNGSKLGYASDGNLFVADADGTDPQQIADSGTYVSSAAWSPTELKLMYQRSSELWVVDVTTGTQIQLAPTLNPDEPDWSPTGQEIAFVDASGPSATLHVIGVDGTGLRAIATVPTGISHPEWSPDGASIAFLAGPGDGLPAHLNVVPAAGGTPEQVSDTDALYIEPLWRPTSDGIAFFSWDYHLRYVDLASGATEDLSATTGEVTAAAWSPVGDRIAFTAYANVSALFVTAPGGAPDEMLAEPAAGTPSWHPDGSAIAFASGGDIKVYSFATATVSNLTEGADAFDSDPEYSPDGTRLAFRRDVVEPFRTVSLDADRRTITYGKSTRLFGQVQIGGSTPLSCRSFTTVELRRIRLSDASERQAVVTAGNEGRFGHRVKPRGNTTYFARVPDTGACPGDTSRTVLVKVRKRVTLTAMRPLMTPEGRVRVQAVVAPCGRHRTDPVILQRRRAGRWVTIGREVIGRDCTAQFEERLRKARLRARDPVRDDDHLPGTSHVLEIDIH